MKKKVLKKPQPSRPALAETASRLHFFTGRKDSITETTRQLVEMESPSDNKPAVDQLGALLAGRFEKIGGHAKFHRAQDFGDHLQVDFAGARSGKAVLLLGHIDTVYPMGTLSTMPCRVAEGRLWGPGALDMKSGIALVLHALEGLRAWHSDSLPRPVTVLLVSDEEVGSSSSRRITESLARRSEAVLVLEPAYGIKGALKTARKGVGEYTIRVTGRAAHSGLDFEKGESAILEMARQITAVSKLVDRKRGLTLNVGLVSGGTRTNVIPAQATASLDVRVARMKDAHGIDRRLKALKPFNRKCKLEITGGVNRPPMERSAAVATLYQKASEIAQQLGWKLQEASVGGGSDGNFTASLGIPTLDGLGGVGEGAHAPSESVIISELPRRAALLAELIECA
ncbi:MAG: M20 family metallopeptidase [Terriglobales bacterium]